MLKKFISYLLAVSLFLTVFITAIDICCFNKNFYASEYSKLNTCDDIGVSDEALTNMTDTLLDYLRADRDDLVCYEEVHGIEREIFNQREKDHMVDVRNLYLSVIAIRNIACVLLAVSLIYTLVNKSGNSAFLAYRNTIILIGFIFAALVVMAVTDFDTFWTNFHHVFFPNNDLWLLDPATDILIMMVPSEFFFDLVIRIVVFFTGGMFVSTAGIFLLRSSFND